MLRAVISLSKSIKLHQNFILCTTALVSGRFTDECYKPAHQAAAYSMPSQQSQALEQMLMSGAGAGSGAAASERTGGPFPLFGSCCPANSSTRTSHSSHLSHCRASAARSIRYTRSSSLSACRFRPELPRTCCPLNRPRPQRTRAGSLVRVTGAGASSRTEGEASVRLQQMAQRAPPLGPTSRRMRR